MNQVEEKVEPSTKFILLVEDDQFLSNLIELKLKNSGFGLIRVRDGVEAAEILKKQKPDLVLLDLILPKKNGFELLEELREDPYLKDLKVVILSNLGQQADIARGKALGVLDYFVKANFALEELVNKIRQDI